MINVGYSIQWARVLSHWGIPGNEKADLLARQAASYGRKPKFRIPSTNFYPRSLRHLKDKFHAFPENEFRIKGRLYSTHSSSKPSLSLNLGTPGSLFQEAIK